MIRFVEVINETSFNSRLERTASPAFRLGEVWINEQYITSMRPAPEYRKLLAEGSLPPDLKPDHGFTSVTTTNGGMAETHIVVGEISSVAVRLGYDSRMLLKG
jgi:hypothetical protein